MDKKETVQTIPFIAHEGEMARLERIIHRLFVVVVLLIVLLVGTNAGWLYYESLLEEVTTTTYEQQTDGEGSNYIVGGDFNGVPTESNGN